MLSNFVCANIAILSCFLAFASIILLVQRVIAVAIDRHNETLPKAIDNCNPIPVANAAILPDPVTRIFLYKQPVYKQS